MFTVKNITNTKQNTPYGDFAPFETKTFQQIFKGDIDTIDLEFFQQSPQFSVTGGVNENAGAKGDQGDQGDPGTSIALIYSGLIGAVQNSSAFGVGVQGGVGQTTKEVAQIMIPAAGSLSAFRAAPDAAVTGLASVTVRVLKNGVATPLTVVFVNADGTTAKTVTGPTAVAAGDLITFEVLETADVDPVANIQASVLFTAS